MSEKKVAALDSLAFAPWASNCEDTFIERSIHGTLGSVQGRPEVRNAVMVITTVESQSDSSGLKLEIAGRLLHHDRVQEGQQLTGTLMHLVYAHEAGSGRRRSSTCEAPILHNIQGVIIPNNVCELCDCRFRWCKSLRRVMFGSSSSLKRIGVSCFELSRIEEVSVPGGVRELGDRCFKQCENLRRVVFGPSSSLERIGVSCFEDAGFEEVNIPDSVRELCDSCFKGCKSLWRVMFGALSSLERIGASCFEDAGFEEVSIPDRVRDLCDGCFKGCTRLCRVTFSPLSSLKRIGVEAFGSVRRQWGRSVSCRLVEVNIPDSVHELGDDCFYRCSCLRRVIFGPLSSLERIGRWCFSGCGLVEFKMPVSVRVIGDGAFSGCPLPGGVICRDGCRFRTFNGLVLSHDCELCYCSYGVLFSVCIPDSVRELCDHCFEWCTSLCRVTFGSSSSLERLGISCFESSQVGEVSIPDGVRELCDYCFKGCMCLYRVIFGPSSSLSILVFPVFTVLEWKK